MKPQQNNNRSSTRALLSKGFLYSGVLLIVFGFSLMYIKEQLSFPFTGKFDAGSVLLLLGIQNGLIALLLIFRKRTSINSSSSYNTRFDIWTQLSPKARLRLAIAVFFIFSIIGPITIFMNRILGDISVFIIVTQTIFSGGISAAVILFGRKPIYLIIAIAICIIGITFSAKAEKILYPQHTTISSKNADIVLTQERLDEIRRQRSNLGIYCIGLIVLGYILFLNVIMGEGSRRIHFEAEVQIARRIQETLLPGSALQTNWYVAEGFTLPATDIAGDYFDYFPVSENELYVIVSDASGHGVGAGIYAAMTKSIIRSQLLSGASPKSLLENLNLSLYRITEKNMFTSLALVKLHRIDKTAQICTAGHHPVLHYIKSEDRLVEYRTPSIALGINKSSVYSEIIVHYSDGDGFYLYTDGIIEAKNSQGELFGIEQLKKLIAEKHHREIKHLKDYISGSIYQFTGKTVIEDDMTVVELLTGNFSS